MHIELANRRWTEEELFEVRQEVLAQWPTGKEVDLDEALDYCRKVPPEKNGYFQIKEAERQGKILIDVAIGLGTLEDTIGEVEDIPSELKPDEWSVFSDAYTRKCRFEQAQVGIDRSYKEGYPVLTGYPIVNYGIKGARKLFESVDSSIYLNASDEDARLQVEIALASGWSRIFSQSLHDLTQHSKDYPLDRRIQNAQYIDRLVSYYIGRGIPICTLLAGNLTGWNTLSYKITLDVLQALLAAEQGAKFLRPLVSMCLNIVQDVAANRAMMKLIREYMDKFGYHDVEVFNKGYPWQGAWPPDVFGMAGVAALCDTIGLLQGVLSLRLRSLNEAIAVPNREGNLQTLRVAKQVLGSLKGQRMPESEELRVEQEMIEKEVRATVDKVLEIGDGDVAVGMVKAAERGILDCNFSPWIYYQGKVLTVRDKEGALRYLEYGNLPLPKEVVEYHKEKITERERAEGKKVDLDTMITDLYWISDVALKDETKELLEHTKI